MNIKSAGSHLAAFAVILAFGIFPSPATVDAQASVRVSVHDSAGRTMDGTATFRAGTTVQSCRTVRGSCRINTLPAGRYQVTLAPVRESAPPAVSVTVPAAGSIAVSLRSRPAPTTSAASTTTTSTAVARPSASTSTSAATATATTGSTTSATSSVVTMAISPGLLAPSGPPTGQNLHSRPGPRNPADTARPTAAGCRSGQLIGPTGRPATGWVQATSGRQRSPRITVAADGRFRICGLPDGQWSIQAQSGRTSHRQSVRVGARSNIQVRIPGASRSIRGRRGTGIRRTIRR